MLECRAAKRVIDGSKHKLNFAELQKIKDQSEEDIVRKIKIIQDSISVWLYGLHPLMISFTFVDRYWSKISYQS